MVDFDVYECSCWCLFSIHDAVALSYQSHGHIGRPLIVLLLILFISILSCAVDLNDLFD